jgi:predicted Zn finger-like uncharacterized protein
MILNCENCDTRYLLSASQLGSEGRRVRCSHCGHEWYQDPPEDESFAAAMDAVEPIPDSVKPVPEGSALPTLPEYGPADEVPGAGGGAGIVGYALAVAILLVALAGGFVFSSTVVKIWPASLAAYELLGVSPKLPGEGLVVDRVVAEVVTGERGLNILQIKGHAMNLKQGDPVTLPPLRVSIRRAGGEVIDSWLIEAPVKALGYEEETSFSTTYPAPPTDAREVNVRLEPFAVIKTVEATPTEPNSQPQ